MDTIVALSSPPGIGAIAVVRLSGPQAFFIGSKISGVSIDNLKVRHAYYRFLKTLDNIEIDDAIVIFYKGPHSYTGEDMVEFLCHSSPAVLTMLIDECILLGARPAEPGEFTKRAFLNGKMDLVQVEAVADIIESLSPHSLEAALNLRKGKLSEIVRSLRDKLLFLISEFEAEIDFEEEELLEMTTYDERAKVIEELRSEVGKLIDSSQDGLKIREGIKVTLIGAPNVGKSSLMNALSKREKAIVTPEPGTTRDLIEEKIVLKGLTVVLIDTAGIREAQSIAETEGVRRSKLAAEEADVILFVMDAHKGIGVEEEEILRDLPLEKTIFVLNKIDLKQKLDKNLVVEFLKNKTDFDVGKLKIFETSAVTGKGLDELSEGIIEKIFRHGVPPKESLLVTNRRHLYHLKKAYQALEETKEALEQRNIELTAFLLREASMELSKILGFITHEEIMEQIFSRFCIGK